MFSFKVVIMLSKFLWHMSFCSFSDNAHATMTYIIKIIETRWKLHNFSFTCKYMKVNNLY